MNSTRLWPGSRTVFDLLLLALLIAVSLSLLGGCSTTQSVVVKRPPAEPWAMEPMPPMPRPPTKAKPGT